MDKDLNLVEIEQENPEIEEDFLNVDYDLTGEEIKTGLYSYHKKLFNKRYTVYSCIFGIIFLNYIFVFIKDPSNIISVIIVLISILAVSFMWFNLYIQRRSAVKAIDMLDDRNFNMQIHDNFIKICSSESVDKFDYIQNFVEVIEDFDKFIISVKKEKIYIIPKRCIEQTDIEKIKNIFKEKLNEKYVTYKN